MKSYSKRTNNGGFSLTELLVAIAIIVTLAAISVTVTLNLKRRANSAKAVSNLREIGSLTLGLASDRNGRLPNEGHYPGQSGPAGLPFEDDKSWDGYVLEYLGAEDIDFKSTPPKVPVSYESMFFHRNDDPSPPTGIHVGNARRTFVYNRSLSDVSISTIDGIARTAMLGELPWQTGSRRVAFKSNSFMDITRMIPNPKNGEELNPGGKFNFVFVDGHIETLSRKESVGKGSVSNPGGIWTARGDD